MSWFLRGVQSAVFYYLSCAPYTTWAYERKQQKANRRARAERDGLEEAEDGIYRHPLPFNTNTYWQEEMTLGPGPPPRKGTKERAKTESARRLNTGGHESSVGGSSADTTLVIDNPDVVDASLEAPEDGWNKKRYQRPDEALWGLENTPRLSDGTYSFGSGSTKTSSGTYFIPRNPAVNELHPPVVSTRPTRKEDTRWMLQPPPPAKVMEGKERGNLSRALSRTSRGSRRRGKTDVSSNNLIGLDKADWREEEGRLSRISGQPHDRDSRPSTASSTNTSMTPRKKRPPPIHISEDLSPSGSHIVRAKSSRSATDKSRRTSKPGRRNRPGLSTIDSSSHDVNTGTRNLDVPNRSNIYASSHPSSPSPSLVVLQELVSPNSFLNTRASLPKDNGAATAATNTRLPIASRQEEHELLTIPPIESNFPGAQHFRFPDMQTNASAESADWKAGGQLKAWDREHEWEQDYKLELERSRMPRSDMVRRWSIDF